MTEISGQPFEVISNPLSDMTRTWCSTCSSYFPLSDYEWVDSGELITEYCARHSTKATSIERFLCSKKFLVVSVLIGFLLGAVGGYFLFRNNALGMQILMALFIGFVGVFIAAALNVSVIGKVIVRRVCGVTDTRVLK